MNHVFLVLPHPHLTPFPTDSVGMPTQREGVSGLRHWPAFLARLGLGPWPPGGLTDKLASAFTTRFAATCLGSAAECLNIAVTPFSDGAAPHTLVQGSAAQSLARMRSLNLTEQGLFVPCCRCGSISPAEPIGPRHHCGRTGGFPYTTAGLPDASDGSTMRALGNMIDFRSPYLRVIHKGACICQFGSGVAWSYLSILIKLGIHRLHEHRERGSGYGAGLKPHGNFQNAILGVANDKPIDLTAMPGRDLTPVL